MDRNKKIKTVRDLYEAIKTGMETYKVPFGVRLAIQVGCALPMLCTIGLIATRLDWWRFPMFIGGYILGWIWFIAGVAWMVIRGR
jgi:hypothetical protein